MTLPWRSVRTSSASGAAQRRTTSWIGRSYPDGLGVSSKFFQEGVRPFVHAEPGPGNNRTAAGAGVTPRPAGRLRSIVV